MDSLRQKMASFLIDAARKGIKALEPESECAKALEKIDIENALKEDINRICEAASFIEIAKITSLILRLETASEKNKEAIKDEIKRIAEDLVARVERDSGELKTPQPCRHLLLNL